MYLWSRAPLALDAQRAALSMRTVLFDKVGEELALERMANGRRDTLRSADVAGLRLSDQVDYLHCATSGPFSI